VALLSLQLLEFSNFLRYKLHNGSYFSLDKIFSFQHNFHPKVRKVQTESDPLLHIIYHFYRERRTMHYGCTVVLSDLTKLLTIKIMISKE
jgi:hypothetical protein